MISASSAFVNGNLPINYTETYYNATKGHNETIWGGSASGAYLSIFPTGGVNKVFKPASGFNTIPKIFNIQNSGATGFGFTESKYNGMYEIGVSMLFINTFTSYALYMIPRIQIAKSSGGNVTIVNDQHSIVPFINVTNGKVGTTSTVGILQLNANDLVRFRLSLNTSAAESFTSSTTAFITNTLLISVRYMGNYN